MQNIKFTIVTICEFTIASSMHKYICIVQPSPLSIARTFSPFKTVTLYPLNTTFSFHPKLILDNYHFTFCLYEFDYSSHFSDFPVAQMIKNLPVMQKTRVLLQKFLWRREWQSTPVFLPGGFHGQRNLAGYRPWGCKELDTTE